MLLMVRYSHFGVVRQIEKGLFSLEMDRRTGIGPADVRLAVGTHDCRLPEMVNEEEDRVVAQRVETKICDPFCKLLVIVNTTSAIGFEAHFKLPPLFYGGRIFVWLSYTGIF